MKSLYIFDLDGTLALVDHRRPILNDTSLSKDERWRQFFAACVDDEPNEPVIEVYRDLDNIDSAYMNEMWIWSARSDEVIEQTKAWLERWYISPSQLKMRKSGDHTPDIELKQKWLNEMSPEDRKRLVAVFDDRDSVVAMYRSNNICCFQVAPGDF